MGASPSRASVAGAGTGMVPCWHLTVPLPIVSAVYPAGAAVLTTVAAGLFPREVNVGSDDATLYLTNYSSGSLQVIPTK